MQVSQWSIMVNFSLMLFVASLQGCMMTHGVHDALQHTRTLTIEEPINTYSATVQTKMEHAPAAFHGEKYDFILSKLTPETEFLDKLAASSVKQEQMEWNFYAEELPQEKPIHGQVSFRMQANLEYTYRSFSKDQECGQENESKELIELIRVFGYTPKNATYGYDHKVCECVFKFQKTLPLSGVMVSKENRPDDKLQQEVQTISFLPNNKLYFRGARQRFFSEKNFPKMGFLYLTYPFAIVFDAITAPFQLYGSILAWGMIPGG